MKKYLLSAMAFMLLATGANAQNFNKTDKEAAPATFSSLSSVAAHQNGPKKLADNQKLLGWSGSTGDAGIGSTGFSSWVSANGIFSDYSRDYSKLKGWKIVGLRYAVAGSLGDNASIYAEVSYGTGDNDYKTLNGSITSSEISEFYTENGQNYIELKWNEAKFSEPYTFTGNETDVFYGYFYTQEKNATPVLFGKQTDATDSDYPNMFLIAGTPSSEYKESVYYISSEKAPYVPCFQLIVEQDGESSVSGIDSAEKAVARQYYSVDGKQLSAPQKGLNIVKMSDGTTMKVVK